VAAGAPHSLDIAELVLSCLGGGQDRTLTIRTAKGTILAVADGAGGTSAGATAAEAALRGVAAFAHAAAIDTPDGWPRFIQTTDVALASSGGQCALVVATVTGARILGASVGDAGAWLIDDTVVDLTANQVRKPLLGTGTLLLASDGLLKYAPPDAIARVARERDLQNAVHSIAELPRLRSGSLPDDVSVVLCRASST